MDNLEKVEKLRERANVSYGEAKEALEVNNWDLLDAMIYLENQGKTAGQASYRTSFESEAPRAEKKADSRTKEQFKSFGEKLKALLKKSDENHFLVERKGKIILELPVWAMILILVLLWEISIVAFVIGLFLGCRYSFRGPGELESANNVMKAASDAVDSIKDSVNM